MSISLHTTERPSADAIAHAFAPLTVEQRTRTLAMLRAALPSDSPRRRRGRNRFRDKEIRRAIRAVTDTGATVERVEVDPASGRISVVVKSGQGEPPTPGAAAWDDATEKLKSTPRRRRTKA